MEVGGKRKLLWEPPVFLCIFKVFDRIFNGVLFCPSSEYQGDYYGPGSNYDFFPHGPPSSQAQSPAESPYILGSGPGAMEGSGHHPSDDQRFTDMISHAETPSPEPGLPSSLHPVPGEAYGGGPSPPFSLASNSSYSAPMSHQGPEMGETTAW